MHFPGVALVTGAASGIGRATAKLFAQEDCKRIVIADRDVDGLAKVKRELEQEHQGVEVEAFGTDVTSEDSVREMVRGAVQKFGRIDYACNVAGILIPGNSTEISLTDWERQFAVNTRGMWLCQREEIAQMMKQDPITPNDSRFESRGAIANVASMAGVRAAESLAAYCATKHAVVGFTKADALYFAPHKIRINAICPGVIKTPMLDPDSHTIDSDELTREMAMKRMGLPEEVAECLLWIVSGRASLVTASILCPNGGESKSFHLDLVRSIALMLIVQVFHRCLKVHGGKQGGTGCVNAYFICVNLDSSEPWGPVSIPIYADM